MKTKTISILCAAAFAGTLCAENLTLVTGEDKALTATGWKWSDTNMWTPTPSQVAGNNLTIDAVTTTEISSTIEDGFTAGNVRIDLAQNAKSGGSGGKGHFFIENQGHATFDSLTLNIDSPQWWGLYFAENTNGSLTINNDFTITPKGNNPFFLHFKNTDVKGNVNFTSNSYTNTRVLNTKGSSFSVGGVFNMIGTNSDSGARWSIHTAQNTIGGLKSETGQYRLDLQKNASIVFTNQADSSWTGGITQNGGSKLSDKTLDIVMDSSATKRQSLNLTAGTINDITIKGGEFSLVSAEATTGKMTLDGGFYATADASTKFAEIDLASGGFIFDADALNGGFTVNTDNLTKSGENAIEIDFTGVSAADFANTYNLIVAGAASGIDASDFVAKNLLGKANFAWDSATNTLSVSFAAVPEPATVAALLGLAALGLAIARRRR